MYFYPIVLYNFFRFDVMMKCWEWAPDNRPSFRQIVQYVEHLLNQYDPIYDIKSKPKKHGMSLDIQIIIHISFHPGLAEIPASGSDETKKRFLNSIFPLPDDIIFIFSYFIFICI